MGIEREIVPITVMSDIDYSVDNQSKKFVGDINELFVFPYNINMIYSHNKEDKFKNNITTSLDCIHSNIYDAIVAMYYEFLSDVFGDIYCGTTVNIPELFEEFFNLLDQEIKLLIIEKDANYTFSKVCNFFNRYISKFTINIIHNDQDTCRKLYEDYILQKDMDDYNRLTERKGNAIYVVISSILRDIMELKLAEFRKQLSMIEDVYKKMVQYSDPLDREKTNEYYKWLTTEKYTTEEEE